MNRLVPTPIIEAVGPDRIVHIVQSMLRVRRQLEPEAQYALDDWVLEFFARTPLALATIMLDKSLPDTHAGELEAILRRAHERAKDDTGRARVEAHAMAAGHFNLFAKQAEAPPEFLTRSQQAGLDRMATLAKLHFAGVKRHGVELRVWPLIVGPSGVGKSNLVRRLGLKLGLPVMRLSLGEWLVSGARTDLTTLQRLRLILNQHERLIVHIDELDKIHSTPDAWTRALLTELYGLLDRQLAVTEGTKTGWTPDLLNKFQKNVFLVGSGTWQEVWNTPSGGGLGFGRDHQRTDTAERIRAARVIPQELLNRFSPTWIMLEPYTADDFREISAGLRLPPGVLDPDAAAESGLNFRSVEAALTAHSVRLAETGEC